MPSSASAIVVIGGLLLTKEEWEWEKACKSISWQFVEGQPEISGILSLSYKDLPYYLKPCFLYLGNFPEYCEFRTEELIQMWAAEGFLEERGEETMEEVGEDYLMQLIQRSIVQVARRNSIGVVKSCRIHDILRDLSISQAKESKFLQVHSGNANAPCASRARRLAIHDDNLSEYTSLKSFTPHLRSVLIYTKRNARLQREEVKFLFGGFKLLRVLYLHGSENMIKLPREIGELIHLRFLSCTDTELERLPSSIGNLSNLQTLFVQSRTDSIKIPSTIGKMQQLRHLRVKRFSWGEIEGDPRVEGISNLQTLSGVKSGRWMEEGCLTKLTNLRKLRIFTETGADAEVLFQSIPNLVCLHSLSVVLKDQTQGLLVPPLSHLLKLSKLYLQGELQKLPESTEFPTNLTKLTLRYSCLEQDPLAKLEKLKNLRILKAIGGSYLGREMGCSAQGFSRLESLHLGGLPNLEEWSLEE